VFSPSRHGTCILPRGRVPRRYHIRCVEKSIWGLETSDGIPLGSHRSFLFCFGRSRLFASSSFFQSLLVCCPSSFFLFDGIANLGSCGSPVCPVPSLSSFPFLGRHRSAPLLVLGKNQGAWDSFSCLSSRSHLLCYSACIRFCSSQWCCTEDGKGMSCRLREGRQEGAGSHPRFHDQPLPTSKGRTEETTVGSKETSIYLLIKKPKKKSNKHKETGTETLFCGSIMHRGGWMWFVGLSFHPRNRRRPSHGRQMIISSRLR